MMLVIDDGSLRLCNKVPWATFRYETLKTKVKKAKPISLNNNRLLGLIYTPILKVPIVNLTPFDKTSAGQSSLVTYFEMLPKK